jgi:hypothetical protein
LFAFEQETEPRRFSIHRLAHYCLDLGELFPTERLVPVVIFFAPWRIPRTFIDIYADLDDNERIIYQQRYPAEARAMSGFAERFIEQGIHKGIQQGVRQGVQQGEAKILVRQLTSRFGQLPAETVRRIEAADADTLLEWSERVLTAKRLDEVLH